MKRAILAGLVALTVASPAVAQGQTLPDWLRDTTYQATWCLYLRAQPFYLDAPADVVCDYEPRPMTVEEAGAYYMEHVGRANYVNDQRNCAVSKAKGLKTWGVGRRWNKWLELAQDRWTDALLVVEWPAVARRQIARLVDRNAAASYRMRVAYNNKTAAAAVLSGDWKKATDADSRASEAAEQVRQALRIRHVPTGGNACKKVRRYERTH